MQPRRPYEYPIELRGSSSLHPLVKSFLLVVSIGSIAGCGYFLAHSPTFQQMFEPEFGPPIAATLPQPPKRSGQDPDTKSENVRSADFRTPIAPSGARTAGAAAVLSPYSVPKSADFSAPSAFRDTPVAVLYTSPDLAPAAHSVRYVTRRKGKSSAHRPKPILRKTSQLSGNSPTSRIRSTRSLISRGRSSSPPSPVPPPQRP